MSLKRNVILINHIVNTSKRTKKQEELGMEDGYGTSNFSNLIDIGIVVIKEEGNRIKYKIVKDRWGEKRAGNLIIVNENDTLLLKEV